MRQPPWLLYALATTALWGVWGALIELPEKAGFPPTLGYAVWALTMVPCAAVVLRANGWRFERSARAWSWGLLIGFTGAGGQLLLFEALRTGPAFLVFPIVSLYPVLTIALSVAWLKERAQRRQWLGIGLALPAIALLSYVPPADGAARLSAWLPLAGVVFAAWGLQAAALKRAEAFMSPEAIFVYMSLSGLLLVPLAVAMTDFAQPIEWGWRGPWLAALVHLLNSAGALALVYALRHGKAIVVVPMTALAPVLTIVLSLVLYRRLPMAPQAVGLVLATGALYWMAD
jgi:drug/metabolite transporter (DMT)-like permease